MGVEVFFEGLVPYKAHTTNCALELDALKELGLGQH